MPIYEYECDSCKDRIELLQKVGEDSGGEACPRCGRGILRKLVSAPFNLRRTGASGECAPSSST